MAGWHCVASVWVEVPALTKVRYINGSYSHNPSQAAGEPLQLSEYCFTCTGLLKSTQQQQTDVTEHCTVSSQVDIPLQIRCADELRYIRTRLYDTTVHFQTVKFTGNIQVLLIKINVTLYWKIHPGPPFQNDFQSLLNVIKQYIMSTKL